MMILRILLCFILTASAVATEPDDASTLRDQLNGHWSEVTITIVAGCDCVGPTQNGIRLTRNQEGVSIAEYGRSGGQEKLGRPAKLTSEDAKVVTDAILGHYAVGTVLPKGSKANLADRDDSPLQIAVHVNSAPLNDTWIRTCLHFQAVSTWMTQMKILILRKR